ncbi:RHS repeat-associated core domain-containing protein [Epilithonimonas hungarica]|uniref:RHS repeat-associated core domain-containing protein n=1 Tax=Epilithonimonas hungarica TaxID=454006 RepID=A0A1G7SYA0_9FLAO|nr:RHS repeat-associated core domain-containing protein [Epilithonimonas hungarica]SDG27399.1 RHS repeat-associated core domain-containing protein [Epilithonimonas hungarica]
MRLSYARNPDTGSIDVLDRNDYYPFGMNMQGVDSSFDTMGSFLNHKYNRKELQETGFYDWRQYMPDLGRWFGVDKLAEKYHMMSPYGYTANNPIMYYDIDGRDMPGWLQNLWDATKYNQVTTFSGFDSSGSPSSISFGNTFSAENFTSFVNFLQGGGTGNYTFWTNGSGADSVGYSNGAYSGNIQGVVGNNIKIKDNGFWNDVTNKVNQGLEYLIKDLFYLEVSGDASMGSFLDIELKNGLGLNLGKRSTIADFWYIKDAGQVLADFGAGTYDQGEKESFNIGGSFIFGANYNVTDKGENTISIGYKGIGISRTWGGGKPASTFIGLDTGVSVGVGFGGSINIKTGLKW